MSLERNLKNLPEVQAPSTLIPRVLERIEANARQPWWRRAWWTWPMVGQAVFHGVWVAVGGSILWGMNNRLPITEAWGAISAFNVDPLVNAYILILRAGAKPLIVLAGLAYGTALVGWVGLVRLGQIGLSGAGSKTC